MVARLLALLLLPACTTVTARALEDPDVRAQVSHRLVVTLDEQEHYFADRAAVEAFAAELRSVANRTTDATSYYRAVADRLATLGEGHTGLVGSAEVPFSFTIPPVAILEVEGQPVIAGVAPGIEGGGLRPGDLLLEIDGVPAPQAMERQLQVTAGSTLHGRRARAAGNLLAGPTDTPASVRVRGLDGRVRHCFPLRFLLDDEGEDRFRFGFVPQRVRSAKLSSTAGYLALPDFQAGRYEEFAEALRPLRGLPVLVLDLRGNPGGRIRTLQRVAGVFTDSDVKLIELWDGDERESIRAKTGATRYRGELEILVDERTGSAAELLAAAMQDLGRATIHGRTTAGSTRARRSATLPGGVVFHYAGRAEFRRRNGDAIEGVGVHPDVVALRTRESLADGAYGLPQRDPAVRLAVGLN